MTTAHKRSYPADTSAMATTHKRSKASFANVVLPEGILSYILSFNDRSEQRHREKFSPLLQWFNDLSAQVERLHLDGLWPSDHDFWGINNNVMCDLMNQEAFGDTKFFDTLLHNMYDKARSDFFGSDSESSDSGSSESESSDSDSDSEGSDSEES
jgi:hypothetical protein